MLFSIDEKKREVRTSKKEVVSRQSKKDSRMAAHARHNAKQRIYNAVLEEAVEDCKNYGVRISL